MSRKLNASAPKEEATPALVPKLQFPEFLGERWHFHQPQRGDAYQPRAALWDHRHPPISKP